MRIQLHRSSSHGFALIEILVSLVIIAFGMLALASMQLTLSRSADVSKQRSEAVRLAQEKMECLRAYTQVPASTTTSANRNCVGALLAVNTWDGYGAAGTTNDPVNPITSPYSNTSYTRSWTLTGSTADAMRALSVTLSWTDRAGQPQMYTVNSVIARNDADGGGSLSFPLPGNTNLRRPKNRNLNIPVPAVNLAGGQSAYSINSNLALIFNDDLGTVVQRCSVPITSDSTYAAAVANGDCLTFNAYIIAGYISGDSNWTGSVATVLPTGINTDAVTGWDNSNGRTISCYYNPAAQAANQNTNSGLAGVWRYYICVIPMTAGSTWGTGSGRIRLAGMTTGTGGAASNGSRWLVCRFQYPASSLFPTPNDRNVQPYAGVATSLDSQNYYIYGGSGTCPSVTVTVGNGPSQQSASVATTLHQTCRTGATVAECPTTFTGP
jgi:prepilin-type N-terminal cleavage/methylation domain-containing protein